MVELQEGLSVVVTNYNNEEFIAKCLDSICNQTFKNMEIIVVDDGSTDNSLEIIQKFAKADARIKVVKIEHKGAAHARKAGIRASAKQYITFPDGDDWVDENLYACMMEKAIEEKVDIVCDNMYIKESRDCQEIVGKEFETKIYREEELETLKNDIFSIAPSLWGKIFRVDKVKKHIENVDLHTQVSNDMQAAYPAIMEAESIYMLNIPGYHYRLEHRSPSGRGAFIKAQSYALTYRRLHQSFDGYSQLLEMLDQKILSERILFLVAALPNKNKLKMLANTEEMQYVLRNGNIAKLNKNEKKICKLLQQSHYGLLTLYIRIFNTLELN